MITPLVHEPEIIGVESNYLLSKDFSLLNTYANLLVIVDPLARALASRPRVQTKIGYIIKEFPMGSVPVAGANGFLWRKEIIDAYVDHVQKKFSEANLLSEISARNIVRYANIPNVGIYHYYCESLNDYVAKRNKIAYKFLHRRKTEGISWVDRRGKLRFFLQVIYLGTFVGPAIESTLNFVKSGRKEWLLHPFISFLTICIYIRNYFKYA